MRRGRAGTDRRHRESCFTTKIAKGAKLGCPGNGVGRVGRGGQGWPGKRWMVQQRPGWRKALGDESE